MYPVQLKKINEEELFMKWDDEQEFVLPMKYLRDRCPCAACAGETVLWREYKPSPLQILSPGKYNLKAAEVVGGYAIALTWIDGHNTGIYAFDYLRRICEEHSSAPAAGNDRK